MLFSIYDRIIIYLLLFVFCADFCDDLWLDSNEQCEAIFCAIDCIYFIANTYHLYWLGLVDIFMNLQIIQELLTTVLPLFYLLFTYDFVLFKISLGNFLKKFRIIFLNYNPSDFWTFCIQYSFAIDPII